MPVPSVTVLKKKSKRTLVNSAMRNAAASTGLPRTTFKRSAFEKCSKKRLIKIIRGM
jgi:hypothetical protein